MRRRKRPITYLFISIVSLVSFSWVIYFFPPNYTFTVISYKLPVISFFFPLLFLFVFSTTTYLSKSTKHGILAGLFAVAFLIFRLNNLTHPFFFLLLASLFLILELMFSYRK